MRVASNSRFDVPLPVPDNFQAFKPRVCSSGVLDFDRVADLERGGFWSGLSLLKFDAPAPPRQLPFPAACDKHAEHRLVAHSTQKQNLSLLPSMPPAAFQWQEYFVEPSQRSVGGQIERSGPVLPS